MKSALIVLAFASAASAETIAVRDLRVEVTGERRPDGAVLADRIRDVTRRSAPEARLGEAADFVVAGNVIRIEQGFLASLELRGGGRLIAMESALGATAEELSEAVAAAAVDLIAARKPLVRAATPEPPSLFHDDVDLEADANAIVAFERARFAEETGAERPEAAAAAWRAVADERGRNPYRGIGEGRARIWESYAERWRAFNDRLSGETVRLRRLLPLGSIADSEKIELVVRFAQTYGPARAVPLVKELGPALRESAAYALDCEDQTAQSCVAMAEWTQAPLP